MAHLPRIAIGTLEPQAESTAVAWALLESLGRAGVRVQSFLSHAYFDPCDGATAITGLPPRHLDSWLMTEDVCREVFWRGTRTSDLAVVEGSFAKCAAGSCGSDLDTLCQWLDLPRLAVVDVRHLSQCRLPERPRLLDGLLLDHVADQAELCRVRTLFESLWKVPVLGVLGRIDALRRQIELIPPGRKPELELCQALGDELMRTARVDAILEIASARPLKKSARQQTKPDDGSTRPPLRVAVAYDDAFGGYFPDTLDLLELHGAEISDFSPLRDDRLPSATDVVYIGCGHPERFAAQLSKNDCLMLALKSHLCGGKRLYAECGGLAYLCHEIEMPGGNRFPMAGLLGATAHFEPTREDPTPTEVRLASDTWLGAAGRSMRGYLNPSWRISSAGALEPCAQTESGRDLLVKRQQALGSRVYLNFAAHSDLIESFFVPHAPAPRDNAPRQLM